MHADEQHASVQLNLNEIVGMFNKQGTIDEPRMQLHFH